MEKDEFLLKFHFSDDQNGRSKPLPYQKNKTFEQNKDRRTMDGFFCQAFQMIKTGGASPSPTKK